MRQYGQISRITSKNKDSYAILSSETGRGWTKNLHTFVCYCFFLSNVLLGGKRGFGETVSVEVEQMAAKRFNVVFSGKLSEGSKPPEVLAKLCTTLGLDNARVRELFKTGAGALIGTELEGNAAYALQDKLRECGAICSVKEIEHPRPTDAEFADLHAMNQQISQPRSEPRPRPVDTTPRWQPPATTQSQGSGIFSLLIKLLFLCVIVGGGWFGYQKWLAPASPAFTAYAGFAEAMARGEYQKALDQADGEARSYAENWLRMSQPTSMKIYGKELNTTPPSVNSIAGDVAWIKHKRNAEVKKSATQVELQVEQTVCRIPPGVASAVCKWPVTFQHEVEMQLIDGTWKVAGFKEIRLTPMDK
jgi:hypothetical protein